MTTAPSVCGTWGGKSTSMRRRRGRRASVGCTSHAKREALMAKEQDSTHRIRSTPRLFAGQLGHAVLPQMKLESLTLLECNDPA
jgi:hypothetical protein